MAYKDTTDWWYYFDKVDKNKAKCKHCNWEKDRGKDMSTNKLKYHLERTHPELFSKKLEAERLKYKQALEKKKQMQQLKININEAEADIGQPLAKKMMMSPPKLCPIIGENFLNVKISVIKIFIKI